MLRNNNVGIISGSATHTICCNSRKNMCVSTHIMKIQGQSDQMHVRGCWSHSGNVKIPSRNLYEGTQSHTPFKFEQSDVLDNQRCARQLCAIYWICKPARVFAQSVHRFRKAYFRVLKPDRVFKTTKPAPICFTRQVSISWDAKIRTGQKFAQMTHNLKYSPGDVSAND